MDIQEAAKILRRVADAKHKRHNVGRLADEPRLMDAHAEALAVVAETLAARNAQTETERRADRLEINRDPYGGAFGQRSAQSLWERVFGGRA